MEAVLDWLRVNVLTSAVRTAIVGLIIAVGGAIIEALTSAVEVTGGGAVQLLP